MTRMERIRAHQWLTGSDHGVSSEAIWHRMMTGASITRYHPVDPDDFGRCVRLLRQFPRWRKRLPEMRYTSPIWRVLVKNWAELEALFWSEAPSGSCPKLYRRMQELGV